MEGKQAIITGITGQDGSYLAKLLIEKGYSVIGVTRKEISLQPFNHRYLGISGNLQLVQADISLYHICEELITKWKPSVIYNLAAQSSVSMSFKDPFETIRFNISSVINFLEAIRKIDIGIRYYQASSSEMYGKVDQLPITNATQLHPLSPYAISKATGHWMVSQYREAYGLYAVSGILFNHESYLRPESFFVKKVIKSAVRIRHGLQKELTVGNIDIRRDLGLASEYVKAIWMIMQLDQPHDFQVCSGSSVSLREIVYYVFDALGIDHKHIIHDQSLYRPAEIKDIYGDKKEIVALTGWDYNLTFYEVLDNLIREEEENMEYGK